MTVCPDRSTVIGDQVSEFTKADHSSEEQSSMWRQTYRLTEEELSELRERYSLAEDQLREYLEAFKIFVCAISRYILVLSHAADKKSIG